MTRHNVLIIDNSSEDLFAASRILEEHHYTVSLALNGNSGIEFIRSGEFSLVLTSLTLDDMPPLSVLQTVRNQTPDAMVIVQSEAVDTTLKKKIFKLGADDYIFKPCESEELLFRVKKNIEHYELKQRLKLQKSFYSSCCVCKKIRIADNGPEVDRWMEVEHFLKEKMEVLLSSTYCPKCAQTVQEDLLVQFGRLRR